MFMLSVLAQWEMQCRAGRLLQNIETALLRIHLHKRNHGKENFVL